jgi:peptidyl-prolyl cis-trans isomerase C
MSATVSNRLLIWSAVIVVATRLIAGDTMAQTPAPPADTQSSPAQQVPPANPTSPRGYNPGELLKGLANPIVANVDGHPITLADVGDAIRDLPTNMRNLPFEDLYPGVLERLIQRQLLLEKARHMQFDQDPVVKRHMQQAAERVLENELLNRLIDSTITEEALLARYQEEYTSKPGPEAADVSVILVPTEEQARKDIAEIAGGADFATVAKRDSRDGSAGKGGSLGFLRQDQMVPEVGAVALALEPGQVSPNPIHSQPGWFVVRVAARKRVPSPGFAEVREKLRHDLLSRGVAQVVKDAMANARIDRFNFNGTSTGRGGAETQGSRGN